MRKTSVVVIVFALMPSFGQAEENLAKACKLVAASPYDIMDPVEVVVGAESKNFESAQSKAACEAALTASPKRPQLQTQMARIFFAEKEFDKARGRFQQASDEGSSVAQVGLAYMYMNGLGGLPKDEHEAGRLLKLAANQGDADAQYKLARMYIQFEKGQEHYLAGVRLLKLAVHKGNAEAMSLLGNLCYQGLCYQGGVLREDDREAVRLWKLAAAKGNAHAQSHLAQMYLIGWLVPKDEREAARLFKLAADQGDAYAQSALADMSKNGLGGLPKDDGEAGKGQGVESAKDAVK